MRKTVAIVQARMGAKRLPGKVLQPLGDRSVLRWVLDRIGCSTVLDEIIVATSEAPADDPLADQCRVWGVPCFRGSEEDVLGRFMGAAKRSAAATVVRVNADNPLIDPHHIADLVRALYVPGADYVSFQREDGTPVMLTSLGFFSEALTFPCLSRAAAMIEDPFQREHVTLGIYTRPEQFKVRFLPVAPIYNDPELRLTLDTAADLAFLQELFEALGDRAATVTPEQVLTLVRERPLWIRGMAARNQENPKSTRRPGG